MSVQSELQTKLHNMIAPEIVATIVKVPLSSGGEPTDCVVILESVICGVLLAVGKAGHDDDLIDSIAVNAKERLVQMRIERAAKETTHG